jgi:hypothetical protein
MELPALIFIILANIAISVGRGVCAKPMPLPFLESTSVRVLVEPRECASAVAETISVVSKVVVATRTLIVSMTFLDPVFEESLVSGAVGPCEAAFAVKLSTLERTDVGTSVRKLVFALPMLFPIHPSSHIHSSIIALQRPYPSSSQKIRERKKEERES